MLYTECLKIYGHCARGSDRNHPQEKEMQKVKVVVEEALQIAEKRREAEGK